jgi:beta-RFAP synthase
VDSIVVRTGSRLHFGLLDVPNPAGSARAFGGVGLMLNAPDLVVRARRADSWTITAPAPDTAARVEAFARRIAADLANEKSLAVEVTSCPPQHVGLGVGTQLALAVGTAVAAALGRRRKPAEIARLLGRGQRSAIGLHGFLRGGFLVDGGKGPAGDLAPLVCRHDFPESWSILLSTPRSERGMSGSSEVAAFSRTAATLAETDALCRIVLLGILPALVERDLPTFGEALHEFNRRAGRPFEAVQGGIYAAPIVAEMCGWLRQQGLGAVGQSSWGPTVFVIGDLDRLVAVAKPLAEKFGVDVRITAAKNVGFETDLEDVDGTAMEMDARD